MKPGGGLVIFSLITKQNSQLAVRNRIFPVLLHRLLALHGSFVGPPLVGEHVTPVVVRRCRSWVKFSCPLSAAHSPARQSGMPTRTMCLVMLYSGIRISDTIQLKRSAVDLDAGKLLLRVMKTGAPLYVRLGEPAIEPAIEALRALASEAECFFWNTRSKLLTAIGTPRRPLSACARLQESRVTRTDSETRFQCRCCRKARIFAWSNCCSGTRA